MEKEIAAIVGKPNDYKICKLCGMINFYETEDCHECGAYDRFSDREENVLKYIDEEYSFYKGEDYTEKEIDTMKIRVM